MQFLPETVPVQNIYARVYQNHIPVKKTSDISLDNIIPKPIQNLLIQFRFIYDFNKTVAVEAKCLLNYLNQINNISYFIIK